MNPGDAKREALSAPATEAAVIALNRLRGLLLRAGAGDSVAAQDLLRELKGFWVAHGPVMRTTGSAVAEELRRQALVALYKWQAQLAAQLRSQQSPPSSS